MFYYFFKWLKCCKKSIDQKPPSLPPPSLKAPPPLPPPPSPPPYTPYIVHYDDIPSNVSVINILNAIKSNIRNFEPLSKIEKVFILDHTSVEQKFELIELYDKCVRTLIKNLVLVNDNTDENCSICEEYSLCEDYLPIKKNN